MGVPVAAAPRAFRLIHPARAAPVIVVELLQSKSEGAYFVSMYKATLDEGNVCMRQCRAGRYTGENLVTLGDDASDNRQKKQRQRPDTVACKQGSSSVFTLPKRF